MPGVGDSGRPLAGTLALLGVVFAALVTAAALQDERPPSPAAATPPLDAEPRELLELSLKLAPQTARRVARLRELRFERPPRPAIAMTDDLRRIADRELAKPRVRAQIRAGDAELKLLGLLDPGESLGDVATQTTSLAAAFYEPRKGRLFVVGDAVPAGPAVTEFILAHELTHALEDQRFGLPSGRGLSDDRVLAETALVEGSATALMTDYAARFLNPFDLAADAAGIDAGTGGLPRFALDEVEFSYFGGMEFVNALRGVTADWGLVDYAYRTRAPATTEQVLHPEKYLDAEAAAPVPAPAASGGGWRLVDEGTVGEFATGQVLEEGIDESRAKEAAAGWGGDAYRLWRVPNRGGERGSCCEDYALAVHWRWDTERDARQFERALNRYVAGALALGPAVDPETWRTRYGSAAAASRGAGTALALAPTAPMARRLAAID